MRHQMIHREKGHCMIQERQMMSDALVYTPGLNLKAKGTVFQ